MPLASGPAMFGVGGGGGGCFSNRDLQAQGPHQPRGPSPLGTDAPHRGRTHPRVFIPCSHHTSPCRPSPLGLLGSHPPTHPGLDPRLTHWPPPQQQLACLLPALWRWDCTPGQQEGGEICPPRPSPALPRAQMLLWPQAAIKGIDQQAFGQVKPSRRKIHVSN